jgi:transposase
LINDTTLLLDLEGLAVDRVERLADGSRLVHLMTDEATARACPVCGTFATVPRGWATTRPRDLPYSQHPLRLIWRKRRWYCTEATCPRASFTESVAQLPPGAQITTRLRQTAGDHGRDHGHTVIQAGRQLGLSGPTVLAAVRTQAQPLVEAEPVAVLGLDETRRGRPRWEKDEVSGACKLVIDRWHVGFVDLGGGQGLLGQVDGRTTAAVSAWIGDRCPAWRAAVR